MIIRGASAENFKSFRSFDVSLTGYNVAVGANASGKSNFISFFRFLSDIHEHGFDNAIFMHGGADYIRHLQLPKDSPVSLTIRLAQRVKRARHYSGIDRAVQPLESTYTLRFAFSRRGNVHVLEDRYETSVNLYEIKSKSKHILGSKVGQGVISLTKKGDKLEHTAEGLPDNIAAEITEQIPRVVPSESTLLDQQLWWLANYAAGLGPALFRIGMYDFDPKLSKKSISVTGKKELESDGSNLALALKSLLSNRDRSRKLHNLLHDLLPFIQKVDVLDQADQSILFAMTEKYFRGKHLPASTISDGTVNIIALIIALYFEDASTVTLEEPERNVHPQLMSKMVQMMKEASKTRQLLVTTHNPEMVKYSDLNSLLLVSRNEDGSSTISYPKNSEDVKLFLEQELGLDFVYAQGLLR